MNELKRGNFFHRLKRLINRWLSAFGFNAQMFLSAWKGFYGDTVNYFRFKRMAAGAGLAIDIKYNSPSFSDRNAQGGSASGQYFHQDLYVARRIHQKNPVKHVDVGSRIDGFVAHVASYRSVVVYDIRPIASSVQNIDFIQCDFINGDSFLDSSCDSLSCLHALEHFGLGRYGDSLDVKGHLIGFSNMSRILSLGGIFYLSVPIGPERVEFNGGRILSIATIVEMYRQSFDLISFSYVDDLGHFYQDMALDLNAIENNCNCWNGCGIFELQKIK